MEIFNIVEICEKILYEKAKYLYDTSENYIEDLNDFLKEEALEEELRGLISPSLALPIIKLIIYTETYVSFNLNVALMENFEDDKTIINYIKSLTLENKINDEIRSEIVEEYFSFTFDDNYLYRHIAYEEILENIPEFLSINPFGILISNEILEKLNSEEEMIITILDI